MDNNDLGGISGSREPDPQAVPALTGFDPGRDITPIDLAGTAMKAAYERIKRPSDPPFDDVKSDYRILAMATALVACEHLVAALRDIRAMKTPGANATVRRMAERAASAIEARRAETGTGSVADESAAPKEDAHDQS
jgi:hypothetical protein